MAASRTHAMMTSPRPDFFSRHGSFDFISLSYCQAPRFRKKPRRAGEAGEKKEADLARSRNEELAAQAQYRDEGYCEEHMDGEQAAERRQAGVADQERARIMQAPGIAQCCGKEEGEQRMARNGGHDPK